MSKKRLGECRPHWLNHGKSGVIFFPFFPTTPKFEHVVPNLEINWRSYFDLLQLVSFVGTAFSGVFGLNRGCFRAPKLRRARQQLLSLGT